MTPAWVDFLGEIYLIETGASLKVGREEELNMRLSKPSTGRSAPPVTCTPRPTTGASWSPFSLAECWRPRAGNRTTKRGTIVTHDAALTADVRPGEVVWLTTTVNGVRREREVVDSRMTLADFLRQRLRLTGTHVGCEHGVCGACTVLVDGDAVRSCLMLAVQADGHTVETVEGLASPDGELTPLQEAFGRCHAVQCGFCTSGFLVSATAALREGPIDTPEQAREALSGNICRCTGYAGMVRARRGGEGGRR